MRSRWAEMEYFLLHFGLGMVIGTPQILSCLHCRISSRMYFVFVKLCEMAEVKGTVVVGAHSHRSSVWSDYEKLKGADGKRSWFAKYVGRG